MFTVLVYGWFTVAAVNTRTRYIERMNLADSEATGRLLDALIHHEVVTANNREAHEATRYEESIKGYQSAQLKSQVTLAALNLGQKGIEALGAGYLLWKTSFMVMAGTMTVGELIMINALLLQLMQPLDHLGANYMQLNQGLVDAREMFTILKTNPAQPSAPPPPAQTQISYLENGNVVAQGNQENALRDLVVSPGHAVGVVFRDVHFGYGNDAGGAGGGAGGQVLRGFDLTVAAGSTVAIVGESGCGKSTLTRMLTKTLVPTRGTVLLDGADMAALSSKSVREVVALVSQDASLFHDDVAYNIAYGRPDASPEQVRAAASLAQLDQVVRDLPQGLASPVGERGSRLSGGQRQRVALARALLRDAPVLLCDEATSALDVYTEAKIAQSLRAARKGKTTVIIAHRLSSVRDADEIVVMEQGRVAERGSHAQLLQRAGSRYAAMWAAQEREVKETGDVIRKDRSPSASDSDTLSTGTISLEDVLAESGSGHSCSGCGHVH